jgi:acyl carrier protein
MERRTTVPHLETMARVQATIRICLKLDADTALPADMLLMGGAHDIDSLDVLLIVTELEREFDVVITDGAMQPTDLSTIEALCLFIDGLRTAASTAGN